MTHRPGYTLIELLVATASASVLLVGLSSALFVSATALDTDDGAIAIRNGADHAVSRVLADIREAREFLTLEPQAVEFMVPDRDGDGIEEQIHYTWSGTPGEPLLRQTNGGAFLELLQDVQSLNFTSLTRSVAAVDVTIAPPPPWPVLESFSSATMDSNVNQLVIPAPAGMLVGEVLVASVVVHNVPMSSLVPPAGWMQLDLNEDANHVTFSLWWKLVEPSEPADYAWRWTGDDEAVGVVLRISNQYAGNPFTAIARADGASADPPCPDTTTTLDDSMVLRIGGFHKDELTATGVTGLTGHIDVFMDNTKEVTGGVGYRVQHDAGATGTAAFELDKSEDYRTVTVVVAPKQ